MTLKPKDAVVLDEVAELLYDYLPGKPHPFGNQSLSFPAIAAELGIENFWPGGSKRPAIRELLERTLTSRNGKFVLLVERIVLRGLTRRKADNPVTREEISRLNGLIVQLGFKVPGLHDPAFLDALPTQGSESPIKNSLGNIPWGELNREFEALRQLTAQPRGFSFERFLSSFFAAHNLAPRGSFRNAGEQIDGSFQLHNEIYLLEAKWQDEQVGQGPLLEFDAKVGGKAKWSRGLFLSYSGFTSEGLDGFARGRQTNIVCMDGLDLHYVLSGRLNLVDVINAKVRRAAETNRAFVAVRNLFIVTA